jgi:hypothetical protein
LPADRREQVATTAQVAPGVGRRGGRGSGVGRLTTLAARGASGHQQLVNCAPLVVSTSCWSAAERDPSTTVILEL